MNKVALDKKDYENNPFFVATTGFELLFNKAKSVGIFMAVLAAIGILGSLPTRFAGSEDQPSGTEISPEAIPPTEFWVFIGVIVLIAAAFFAFLGIVLKGISDYSASQIAHGKSATLNEALRAVFANFWSYAWVLVIVGVKTLLWSFLFVIPGIIMAIRYSLAGVSFFDTKTKGNGAVKQSLALTKGAWFTTFGSQALLNILTFGAIQPILEPGTNAVLYRQYSQYGAGEPKPKAHILSILTALIPLLLIALLVVLMIAFTIGTVQNYVEPQNVNFI